MKIILLKLSVSGMGNLNKKKFLKIDLIEFKIDMIEEVGTMVEITLM